MTTISKEYRCSQEREDTLRVVVYTGDQDAALNINGGETIILGKKKIRKLIKQLKKALPEKAKQPKDEGFSRENVHGNIRVGDTVVIKLPGANHPSDTAEGTVIEVDDEDQLMPLRLQLVGGIRNWIWFDEQTRVFKLN